MSKTLRWLIAVLAVFALIASACGDDDDTASGDDGAASDDGGDDGAAADDGGDDTASGDDGAASDDGGDDGAAADDGGDDGAAADDGGDDGAAADDGAASDDGGDDGAAADDGGADGEGAVGYISLGDAVPFVKLVSDSIQAEADAAGVDLVFCDSEIDAAKALECAQLFATRNVEVVLNFQVDQQSSPEICAAYNDVPTIAIDIVQEPCQVAFMGANNRGAGELAGAALGEYFATEFDCEYDAYVSLESTAAGDANADRMGGYRDGFTQHCPIINERILDGADRTDPALEQMTDLLPALPGERIAVVAINEDGILGAIAAARTLGRDGDLYYSGQGTDPSIWCEIRDNPNYIASTAYFPERYGEILIPAAQAILRGETVDELLFTEHQIITSENIEDIYDVTDCG